MSPKTHRYKYVMLGCGTGAGYAAVEFVKRGLVPGELALIGAEPELPYERPALSKAVLTSSKVRLPGFHTCVGGGGDRHNRDFYDTHGIALYTGETVVNADLANKTLVTQSGQTIVGERALILATGARPIRLDRLPGAGLRGIMYLREYADALALFDALHHHHNHHQYHHQHHAPRQGESKTGDSAARAAAGGAGAAATAADRAKTVIVIGGGYIGMEVAAAAATVGCSVKMIFPEDHLMPRLFTPEIAGHYEAAYAAKGVSFINHGHVCKEFLDDGTGAVRGVRVSKDDELSDIGGELVVVGVGARPNTELFTDQVDMDGRGGVVVDGLLKTSIDGVYACGDIATFPLKMHDGKPTRTEHVTNARMSAVHAVKSVYGGTDDYDYLPFFYSRVFNLSWQFFGENPPEALCVVAGDFAPKLTAFWIRDKQVVGVFFESPSEKDTEAMKAVARTRPTVDVALLQAASTADDAFAIVKAAAGLDYPTFMSP